MGPSGVGKSYSAQALADSIYKDPKHFFEISGNEYNAGTHSLDYMKLLGAAKTTKNGEQDGSLVQWLKENDGHGVMIINEGDKMHADVWKKLMEFLEKGKISDNEGKAVWGRNVVVLITSNRGATRMFPASVANWSQADIDRRLRELSQDELRGYYLQKEGNNDNNQLPREILNRIDEFIPYGPLSKEAAVQIANAIAQSMIHQYQVKYGLDFQADKSLIEYIALTGFKASDDARQIGNQVKKMFTLLMREGLDGLQLKSNDVIHLTLGEDSRHEKVIVATANNHRITVDAPKEIQANTFKDTAKMARLKGLESTLKSIVLGQDEAMTEIAHAVLAYELSPKKERPFTALLLGPSGNGKTETGRALAQGMFESQDRVSIIPMGNITTVADFDTIFGSPAQYQGGDVERQFERSLRENPNGAVIILDEISNMGGQDSNMKRALFYKLYNMLEEGKYTSPRDGRVYDLTKYMFVLTGNDGEENFAGVTADDLLLDTWKSIKTPDKVRDLMRRAGIPNAFTNRMVVKLLMKPLLSTEVDGVTQKLWQNQVRDFVAANPGVEIVTEEGFRQKLAKAFFSADQGARIIRDVLSKHVGAVIGLSLMASGIDTTNMHGLRVVVGLEDNLTSKPYFVPSRKERNVEFTATVYENGKVLHTERIPVTGSAVQQVLLTSRDARLTAFHEAGHAVANDPSVTFMKTSYITIRGGQLRDSTYYGYARVQPVGNSSGNLDHDKTVALIARLWAGRKAQEMAGFNADTGWAKDLEEIRSIGGKYLTTWGLDRDLLGLQLDKEGNPLVGGPAAALFHERLNALIDEGEALAGKLLQARWREVRAITAELLLHGEIKTERIDEIKATLAGEIPGKKIQKLDWNYLQYKARGNRCQAIFLR
jgi:ATP-dependent Clp protease ATP-binding subunit ClpA